MLVNPFEEVKDKWEANANERHRTFALGPFDVN